MEKSTQIKLAVVVLIGAVYVGWRINEEKANLFPQSPPAANAASKMPPPQQKKNPPPLLNGKPILPNQKQLVILDTKIGTGTPAKKGDPVWMNYRGMLIDGTEFDNSFDRHMPFPLTIGGGMVIKGWDQGLIGMKAGGKRRLVIPPELGYGPAGHPPTIPPSAVLVFDVEMVSIGKPPPPPAMPKAPAPPKPAS